MGKLISMEMAGAETEDHAARGLHRRARRDTVDIRFADRWEPRLYNSRGARRGYYSDGTQ